MRRPSGHHGPQRRPAPVQPVPRRRAAGTRGCRRARGGGSRVHSRTNPAGPPDRCAPRGRRCPSGQERSGPSAERPTSLPLGIERRQIAVRRQRHPERTPEAGRLRRPSPAPPRASGAESSLRTGRRRQRVDLENVAVRRRDQLRERPPLPHPARQGGERQRDRRRGLAKPGQEARDSRRASIPGSRSRSGSRRGRSPSRGPRRSRRASAAEGAGRSRARPRSATERWSPAGRRRPVFPNSFKDPSSGTRVTRGAPWRRSTSAASTTRPENSGRLLNRLPHRRAPAPLPDVGLLAEGAGGVGVPAGGQRKAGQGRQSGTGASWGARMSLP